MSNSFHDIELSALVEFLKNSWDFINNKNASKKLYDKSLIKTPWYLVIGPDYTGKSRLIQEAGLSWIPEAQHLAIDPKDEDSHHKRCNLWVAKECILLDIPGNYFSADVSPDYLSWPEFLQQLQKYNKQKPFAGVILTLDILSFVNQNKTHQNTYLQNIRKLLLALAKTLTLQCPLFIITTKLDKVAGFSEFFSDLGQEERSQPFGFEFGQSATLNLAAIFKTRMEQMLKRLHERVIWRLHQERKEQKRTLIQNFPLQLEALQNNLGAFIYQLADICGPQNKLPLQGVYFVSNCQENNTTDIVHKTVSQGLTIPAVQENLIALTPHSQTFFSKQLFKKILGSKINLITEQISTKRSRKLRLTAYGIASGLIISSSAVLAYNFNHKINLINQAQSALTNYRLLVAALPAHDSNINQTLPALNALQLAVTNVQNAHLPVLLQDFSHTNSLNELAQKTYHEALNNYFLASLSSALEQILNNSQDPDTLYSTLKIYLMLGDPSHFDAQAINNWFNAYWNQGLGNNPMLKQQLTTHLAALLSQPVTPLELNQTIINKVRANLNSQPAVLLAYSIVKNQSDVTKINPFKTSSENKVFDQVFSNNETTISSIFTEQQFRNIYFIKIPEACTTVINGSDWVLGVSPRNIASTEDKQTLVASTQELYLRDYANNWQALLVNLDILGWENLAQADSTLSALLSDQSPLIHILRVTADNTALDKLTKEIPGLSSEDIAAIKANLSFQFDGLSLLLNNAPNNTNSLDHILVNLTQLRSYIDQIYTSNDPNHASFVAAKKHFSDRNHDPIGTIINTSPMLPEPIRDWLNSLATNTWRLVLENTQTYLNNTWQTTILPVYNANLINRYPLDKYSNQDIAFDDFTAFFGPNGLVDNFTKTNLDAFIDKSHAQWQVIRLDGQALSLSDDFLKQLERASLIQTMYFGDKSKPNVIFSLQPLALEPGVQQFKLEIAGQTVETAQNTLNTPTIIAWPGTGLFNNIILTFTNATGEKTSSTFTGPWSLFKLIDQSNLQATDSTKRYNLTFDLDGNDARYELLATSVINPFIPGIINTYRCPEQLSNS